MNNFFRLPVFGFKRLEIFVYRLNCPACGYERTVELKNPGFGTIFSMPGSKKTEVEPVDKVPKRCPQCGKRLKRRRIPIPIYS